MGGRVSSRWADNGRADEWARGRGGARRAPRKCPGQVRSAVHLAGCPGGVSWQGVFAGSPGE
eukprot:14053759-Alexandrium_andersonii.AAC.1